MGKRICLILLLLWASEYIYAITDVFPPKPKLSRFVYDEVSLLSASEKQNLENLLVGYNDTTTTQIAVVILKTIHGYTISDYAFQLGEKWGIGQRNEDNGILFLIAPNERKMFIATGYGMEHKITDAYTKMLIENIIKPHFKQGQYYSGIRSGTEAIMNKMSGEYKGDGSQHHGGEVPFWFILLFLLFVLLIIYFISKNNKLGNNWNGGGTWNGRGWTGGTWIGSGGNWSGGGGGGGWSGRSFGGGSFGGGGAGGDW